MHSVSCSHVRTFGVARLVFLTTYSLAFLVIRVLEASSKLESGNSGQEVIAWIGQEVNLVCRNPPHLTVGSWTFKANLSEIDATIYSASFGIDENFKRFNVTVDSNGHSTVFIRYATLKDAGIYTCFGLNEDGSIIKNSSKLVVKVKDISQSAPANVAVMLGKNTVMECRSESDLAVRGWSLRPMDSTTEVAIYNRDRRIDKDPLRFKAVIIANECNIHINSIELKDAGIYTCEKPTANDITGHSIFNSAHLIVLESHPSCTTEVESQVSNGDIVRLRCTVNFRGHWSPQMEWRKNGPDGPVISDGVQVIYVSNRNLTSTLTLKASLEKSNIRFRCRTFFSGYTGNVFVTARNIPDYQHIWTSPVLNETSENLIIGLVSSLSGILLLVLTVLVFYLVKIRKSLRKAAKTQEHGAPPRVSTVETNDEEEYATIPVVTSTARTETQTTVDLVYYSAELSTQVPLSHQYRKLDQTGIVIEETHPSNSGTPPEYMNVPSTPL